MIPNFVEWFSVWRPKSKIFRRNQILYKNLILVFKILKFFAISIWKRLLKLIFFENVMKEINCSCYFRFTLNRFGSNWDTRFLFFMEGDCTSLQNDKRLSLYKYILIWKLKDTFSIFYETHKICKMLKIFLVRTLYLLSL